MNNLTIIVKEKIKSKYKNVRKFSTVSGISYTTLLSALEKGLGGTAVETVIKICDLLDIDLSLWQKTKTINNLHTSNVSLSSYEEMTIKKYRTIDEYGKRAVNVVLDVEYERCTIVEDEEDDNMLEILYYDAPVSAGFGAELFEDVETSMFKVMDTPTARSANFALRVSGDSMEPTYSDGDIILVRETPSIDIGKIGIFIINGEGFVKENGGDKLISLNDNYEDIYFTDEDSIYCKGEVVGKI